MFRQGTGELPLALLVRSNRNFSAPRSNLLPVTLQNADGKECQAQAVNLSTGGMGLESIPDPIAFTGLLDVSFLLPNCDTVITSQRTPSMGRCRRQSRPALCSYRARTLCAICSMGRMRR